MKKLVILVMLLCSCGSYQYVNDTMLVTETTDVSMFSNYDTNIIRFVIKPITPRFYFANNYGYWGMRPLWLDFNFYHNKSKNIEIELLFTNDATIKLETELINSKLEDQGEPWFM